MSLADELLADLEEIGDEPDDEEQTQVCITHAGWGGGLEGWRASNFWINRKERHLSKR